jgi:hypothetical protein
MRSNLALFAAAVSAFIVIGIDAWLCTRTMTTAACRTRRCLVYLSAPDSGFLDAASWTCAARS